MVAPVGPLFGDTPNVKFDLVNFDYVTWHDYEHGNWRLADGLLAAALGLSNIQGLWERSTQYLQGQRVVSPDTGKLYECMATHVSGSTTLEDDIAAHPDYWSVRGVGLPAFRGQWQPNTTYQTNDFLVDKYRYAAVLATYTSGNTFDDDLANERLIVVMDVSAAVDAAQEASAIAIAAAEEAQAAAIAASANARCFVGAMPPDPAQDSMLWFDPERGRLMVRYNDGNSSQWLSVSDALGAPDERNILDNGDLSIRERGNGPFTVNGMTVDRWRLSNAAASVVSVTTLLLGGSDVAVVKSGIARCLSIDYTSGSNPWIIQRNRNPTELIGRTVTLSAWVKAPSVGATMIMKTLAVIKTDVTLDQLLHYETFASTNWTYVTYAMSFPTVEGDLTADSETKAETRFVFQTIGQWLITGMRLEYGGVATGFRPRGGASEREFCRRYFQAGRLRWAGSSQGSRSHAMTVPLPTRMAISSPVVSFTVNPGVNATSIDLAADDNIAALTFTGPAAEAGVNVGVDYTLDAEVV